MSIRGPEHVGLNLIQQRLPHATYEGVGAGVVRQPGVRISYSPLKILAFEPRLADHIPTGVIWG